MRPGSATIEDLGRNLRLSPAAESGGRNLVLDLLPYGVSAIRIGAPRVQLATVTPYPSEPVLTTMQSRFNELSAQLGRLNHGLASAPTEPANPGFEPGPGTGAHARRQAVSDSSPAILARVADVAVEQAAAGWRWIGKSLALPQS